MIVTKQPIMIAIGNANTYPIIAAYSDIAAVPKAPRTTIKAVFANDMLQSCMVEQSNGGGPLSYSAITHVAKTIPNPIANPAPKDANKLALTIILVRSKKVLSPKATFQLHRWHRQILRPPHNQASPHRYVRFCPKSV